MPATVSLFDFTLTANATAHDNLKSVSGTLEFLDASGNVVNGVQYALLDVTVPEPRTSPLVLAALLAASASLMRRHPKL